MKITYSILTVAFALPLSQAASIITLYNTANLSGGPYGIRTGIAPVGFVTPDTTDVVGSPFQLVGLTNVALTNQSADLRGIPAVVDLGAYISFTLTPAGGIEYTPTLIRTAVTAFSSNFDGNADFVVRTSQDNFATVVGDAFLNNATQRNVISGTQTRAIRDLEADVSSLAPTTDPIEFRLYFTDDDGRLQPMSSGQTFLYGFQFFGETAVIPEPSSALLGLLGLFGVIRRKR